VAHRGNFVEPFLAENRPGGRIKDDLLNYRLTNPNKRIVFFDIESINYLSSIFKYGSS
jgi:hypothetical protein